MNIIIDPRLFIEEKITFRTSIELRFSVHGKNDLRFLPDSKLLQKFTEAVNMVELGVKESRILILISGNNVTNQDHDGVKAKDIRSCMQQMDLSEKDWYLSVEELKSNIFLAVIKKK